MRRQNERACRLLFQGSYVGTGKGFNFLKDPILLVEINEIERRQEAGDCRNASVRFEP